MPGGTPPATGMLEGRQAGQSILSLSFTMTDGTALNTKQAAFTFGDLRLMEDTDNNHAITGADNQVLFTRIANWENAYDAAFNVRNNADPDNFIEQDPSRFYISVSDPAANTDPASAERIQVALAVLNADATVRDNASNIDLLESGPNTGVFLSKGYYR